MSVSPGIAGVAQSLKPRSPYAVQIVEVLDEEFIRHDQRDNLEDLICPNFSREIYDFSIDSQDDPLPGNAGAVKDGQVSDHDTSGGNAEARRPFHIHDVLDEDLKANMVFDSSSETGATLSRYVGKDSNQSRKSVRFADTGSALKHPEVPVTGRDPEDLRFIFFGETRDFNLYQELRESYQVLADKAKVNNSVQVNESENTTMFITNSPYTPPATVSDLQRYRVPASYYHTFWHPERIPIYLHGNVFDGISLTNWIYNWTAYTFKGDSYQMNAVRRFGETVVRLSSAMSDIEHAMPVDKSKIPRELDDESGVLWADLENFINDIMSEAESRLGASKNGRRLEVEFASRFSHELIAGKRYHHTIERFLTQTEAWCKKARFHPDCIMIWELWET